MIRYDVPVNQCDQCGHQWLAESDHLPERCPSRKCRSVKWHLDIVERALDHAEKVGAVTVQINEQEFKVHSRCPNKDHSGFQRADGYWCATCRKMYS